MPRPALVPLALLGLYVLLFEAVLLVPGDLQALPVFSKTIVAVVQLAAAALVLARGLLVRDRERLAWLCMGAGALSWAVGDAYWYSVLAKADDVPVPSAADLGYLALIPLGLAGLLLLARARTGSTSRGLLLDGATAALAAGAISATIVLEQVADSLGDAPAQIATNLGYVVGDVVLLAVVVGTIAVRGWRLDRTWGALGGAFVLFWVADSHYLLAVAADTYAWPNPWDVGWMACLVLLGAAAWSPVPAERPPPVDGARLVALPLAFAAAGLAILLFGAISSLNPLAVALSGASMLAVFGRLALVLREHDGMLRSSRVEARTDALTGLGNRRALIDALEARLSPGVPPAALAIFDLDGFKTYNDTFGHPAGDALLQRLAGKLAQVLPVGAEGFRMGGDEFCVLAPLSHLSAHQLARLCALALTEEGDGFRVGCSFGAIALPAEAADSATALRLADERLYLQKHSGRASAGVQSSAVLLTALAVRDPELGLHLDGVADLAAAVGAALGLAGEDLDDVRRAAELHDVGKVGIPDAILSKPGPLDAGEWVYMRRHTVIGERILSAAPSLRRVASYVRSSHERWDGAGYPDGLAADAIPLGARIVAACDAFDAMRTDRPYRSSMPPAEAHDELRRCAGTQFDPVVVAALLDVLAAQPEPAPATAAAPSG